MFRKKTTAKTKVESKILLPVTLLENHVNSLHHPKRDSGKKVNIEEKSFSENYENVDWCFMELPVEGKVEIRFSTGRRNIDKYISVPVSAGFLVVCTKADRKEYKVASICSLS